MSTFIVPVRMKRGGKCLMAVTGRGYREHQEYTYGGGFSWDDVELESITFPKGNKDVSHLVDTDDAEQQFLEAAIEDKTSRHTDYLIECAEAREELFYENPDHPVFKKFKESELATLRLNRVNRIGERIALCKKLLTK